MLFVDDYVWYEVRDALERFYRLIIPAFEDRTPITPTNFFYTLAYVLPLTFLAFLARRPNTRIVRILLVPSVVCITLHSCLGYKWTGRGMHVYNWGEGLCCLTLLSKVLEFGFTSTGRYKVGERELGQDQTPAISKKDYDPHDPTKAASTANGHARAGRRRPGASFLPLWVQDGLELVFTFRGVGWDFGRGVHMPAEHKPFDRGPFLLATLHSFLHSFLTLDFLESCLKLVPGVGSLSGGTIFLPSLPPMQRYALSTAIHLASGFSVLAGFQMCYDLSTMVGVGLLGHVPASWPPVQDAPWRAASLAELWARRWHQLLRRAFLVLGGVVALSSFGRRTREEVYDSGAQANSNSHSGPKESKNKAKTEGNGEGGSGNNRKDKRPRTPRRGPLFRIMSVLLTFIASGAFHEVSASISMGRGTDIRGALFFAMQGPLVVLETIWERMTGKRVGGWAGRVWVWVVVGVLGQQLIDSWHMRGLAGGLVIPPRISPTRQVLFPIVGRLTGIDLDEFYIQD